MTFQEFEARAREVFADIPPEYREGVDGLVVERRTAFHPTLPEIYTLGECVTENYPTEFGGPGEVRSFVVLYYGSFLALSARGEGWDWEEEIFETVTHEVRHHLESLARDDALEVLDWVEDQNFRRREGEPFDPLFYRGGEEVEPGAWEVAGDLFVERELSGGEAWADFALEGRSFRVAAPGEPADVHFVTLEDLSDEAGDVVLVLHRRRGTWERLRAALTGRGPGVAHAFARTEGSGTGAAFAGEAGDRSPEAEEHE